MRKACTAILFLSFSLLSFNTLFAKIEREEADQNNVDNSITISRIGNEDIEVTAPYIVYSFLDTDIKLKFVNPEHTRLLLNKNKIDFIIDGADTQLNFVNGEASFKKRFDSGSSLTIFTEEFSYNHKVIVIRLWEIILPIALLIALIVFRIKNKHKA